MVAIWLYRLEGDMRDIGPIYPNRVGLRGLPRLNHFALEPSEVLHCNWRLDGGIGYRGDRLR